MSVARSSTECGHPGTVTTRHGPWLHGLGCHAMWPSGDGHHVSRSVRPVCVHRALYVDAGPHCTTHRSCDVDRDAWWPSGDGHHCVAGRVTRGRDAGYRPHWPHCVAHTGRDAGGLPGTATSCNSHKLWIVYHIMRSLSYRSTECGDQFTSIYFRV